MISPRQMPPMDYNTDLKVVGEVTIGLERAKKMVREFMLDTDVLEGIQMLQLEELLDSI